MDNNAFNFKSFLAKNSVPVGGTLPLVHSTPAYHLSSIASSDKITAGRCDVFTADHLNYFFVGRPAYKLKGHDGEAAPWELPCSFIFDFATIDSVKRIFPFDSGAFSRNFYPQYIGMIERDEFEVSAVPDAASKIVGAYFGNASDYFRGEPRSARDFRAMFDVSVLQAQALALHRLSTEKSATTFDDRRLTIEVQSDSDLDLTVCRPLAVIAPEVYFDIPELLDVVQNHWNAQPLSYGISSLSVSNYYNSIYQVTKSFYEDIGLL